MVFRAGGVTHVTPNHRTLERTTVVVTCVCSKAVRLATQGFRLPRDPKLSLGAPRRDNATDP